ncbi:MAG: hypothetical protein AVDCRST_MAG18-4349 [uncultured Thermomicrobiales bacterium]|uniref:Uncharacterized protein n=1 Tax=uncultured Thermomicrobiales bacterium TaxID=1645740 RepID=A0A6J4VU43_9BACT|nr:MAG: hypothetical protein AVDCRST_MAG18-4349 [uncultured Thermomicrobiales bacterium]
MATPPPYNPQNVGGTPPQPGYPTQPGHTAPPLGYAPPPPPKRGKRGLWIGGGIAAVLLLCCVGATIVGVILGPRLVRVTAGNIGGARNATEGYYDAVRDHDWAGAHDYLSRSLGSSISPTALQTLWTTKETTVGRVSSFSVTNTNVSSNNGRTTAIVTGTLRYARGSSETKTVNLVKEGDDWRLSNLP